MATAIFTSHCLNCEEQEDIYACKGCLKTFCYQHLPHHREEINRNFNQLQDNSNLFRENIIDQKNHINNRPSIEKINKWEKKSIEKIKQTADKCRERIINYTNEYIIDIEKNLNDISEQSKQIRKENKLNETLLIQLITKLEYLRKELDQPSKLLIRQKSSRFIEEIYVITPFDRDDRWKQNGLTIAGGNDRGDQLNQLNQLNEPEGICIDDNQTVYIADYNNHSIVEWKSNTENGRIVAGGNGAGEETNQLTGPTTVIIIKENNSFIIADSGNRRVMRWSRQNNTTNGKIIIEDIDCWGLAMDKDGSIYVSDCENGEVRRWKRGENKGTVVAGGNGEGDGLDKLSRPTYIFVDENYSLYVSDENNHRVMKWTKDAEEGIIVAGGNDEGGSLKQLSHPGGVIVDQLGRIYVADCWNDRVMCWCEGDEEGRIVVGGNSEGNQSIQFDGPCGLSFDVEGNLYVADHHNDRIQKFELNLNN